MFLYMPTNPTPNDFIEVGDRKLVFVSKITGDNQVLIGKNPKNTAYNLAKQTDCLIYSVSGNIRVKFELPISICFTSYANKICN